MLKPLHSKVDIVAQFIPVGLLLLAALWMMINLEACEAFLLGVLR